MKTQDCAALESPNATYVCGYAVGAGCAATGVCVVLIPLYATASLASGTGVAPGLAVGAIQTGLGVGLVLGSGIVGGVGHRIRTGRLVIIGYVSSGLLIAFYGISGSLWVAVPLVVAGHRPGIDGPDHGHRFPRPVRTLVRVLRR